jgi:hypothetical protein
MKELNLEILSNGNRYIYIFMFPKMQCPHVGSFRNNQYVIWVAFNENQSLYAIPTCEFILK